MTTFDGFFMPGFDVSSVTEWRHLEAGELRVRYPNLTRAHVTHVWQRVIENRNRVLVNTPVARIVAAIDAAAQSLCNNTDTALPLIHAVTGYSEPVIRETLEHMYADWSAHSLNTMLAAELGDARVLDHAVPDAHVADKQTAAFGYARAFHVFSGNVPGVAVTSLIRSLLVKSATLCKTASDEPVLPVLFARALNDVAPAIAGCVAISYWPQDARETQDAALQLTDLAVVYGGANAVENIRRQLPTGKTMVAHGPRLSFGVVGSNFNAALAQDVAHAVAAYDQQGCVSPHVVYVIGDAEKARSFARDVAQQLEQIGRMLPRGVVRAEEAVAIRNARTAAEFSETAEAFGSETAGYVVICETSPQFRLSCLNRVVYVKPLSGAADLTQLLPAAGLLQSAAIEGFSAKEKAELARMLGLYGVSRITSFAQLPWPPMHWHHDGSAPLRELLWWQDIEA